MDIYDKTVKFNFKNTCSHTVYLECHVYTSKIYHGYQVGAAWDLALAADNMVQNPLSFGTEETKFNIGKRPDMKLADLGVRYKHVPGSVYKICLEPGQETSYTHVTRGGRWDQAKYNVLQGSQATGDDVVFMPRLSSRLAVFARSEMVVDALDTDVTFGSGHVAVNAEVWRSWAAVPYLKPIQYSFQNNWGDVPTANEQDLNQYQANNDVYEEQV